MVVLLVSLGALLLAAAGVARHIRLQRAKSRSEAYVAFEAVEEADLEPNS